MVPSKVTPRPDLFSIRQGWAHGQILCVVFDFTRRSIILADLKYSDVSMTRGLSLP